MIADLEKLGLSDEEARVYVACLEINGGPISVVAKKAGVHRVSCYHTIDKLLDKQLLSQYTKNGVKYVSPEPPEHLLKMTEEKMTLAKSLLPELQLLASALAFKPTMRSYEGADGVRKVFEESLSAKGEIQGYTNLRQFIDFSPQFFEHYTQQKLRKGIKTRFLSPNTVESVRVMDPFLPKKFNRNLLEILLVNKEQFLFENEILIFNNAVGIVSLKKEELLGVVIESPTFARTMKAVFDLAWLGATAFVAR